MNKIPARSILAILVIIAAFFCTGVKGADTTYVTRKMTVGTREMPMKSTFVVNGSKITWTAPPLLAGTSEKVVEYAIKSTTIGKDTDGAVVHIYDVIESGLNETSTIEIRPSGKTITNIGKIQGTEIKLIFVLE